MVCGTFTATTATQNDAEEMAKNYRANDPPPNAVSVSQNADGTWTVTAVWPPCPAGTTHSAAAVPAAVQGELIKGFDSDRDCGPLVTKILAANVAFVGRYYSHNPSKNLSFSEAKLLSGAGIKIVAVWEARGDMQESFSHASGVDDATSAYSLATSIGQPSGTPIYFAVDFDATPPIIAGSIHDYFQGVADGFAAISRDNPAYRIGVYGSGLVCSWLRDRNLVAYTWLSQSMGWAGSREFDDWNIAQHIESDPYGFGFTVDPNDARTDYGGFSV